MKELQDIIGQKLAKAVASKIDVEKLATQLAPRIQQLIVQKLLTGCAEEEWWEWVADKMDTRPIAKLISKKISEAFEKQ